MNNRQKHCLPIFCKDASSSRCFLTILPAIIRKLFLLLIIIPGTGLSFNGYAQTIADSTKNTAENTILEDSLFHLYGHHKTLPEDYKLQVLLALSHFPELKEVKINYLIKATYVPLSTRPDFWSMFKRKSKRSYIITLSNKTIDTLRHLLYSNLGFEEQVGIMGHELSHVADFRSKNALQSLRNAIGHLFPRYIDKMEYNTDMICIKHGLGKQLQAYSTHVRTAMHVHYWRGVDYVWKTDKKYERYMNPDTIEKYTKAFSAAQ